MNILVIGLGSMGKRRIRLIKELYSDYDVYGIDGRSDRRMEAIELYKICCYSSLEKVDVDIDCAFVCTAPLSHNAIITECLKRRWDVFTELNLVNDGYEYNMQLAKRNDCILFLSSTFFYREEIKYIQSRISKKKKWNYIYHVGQYLPDWHPWERYNDFFVGDRRTNGCREIFAIELPWIINTFGNVLNTNVVSDKLTELNIDFNDNYIIQICHENGNKGVLIVDVVSPCAVRNLEIYSEGEYIKWNGTPEGLFEYCDEKGKLENIVFGEETERVDGYQAFVVENAYKNEIKEFFDVKYNKKEPMYGFEKDRQVLDLIDKLEA